MSVPASDRRLRVLLAQQNPTVGDVAGNAARVAEAIERARAAGADLAVFPEMVISGYPPEDLLLRPSFIAACERAVEEIARSCQGIAALVGFPDRAGDDLHNAAALLAEGRIVDVYHKTFLPNYSVFDEERYFRAGRRVPLYALGEALIGPSICEDIWYPTGPPERQAAAGAELIVNLSASPYEARKQAARERMLATRAADNAAFLVYCNLVGGQDELLFDGNSLVVGPEGEVLARGASMAEDELIVDLPLEAVFRRRLLEPRFRKARVAEARAGCALVSLAGGPRAEHPPAELRGPDAEAPLDGLEEIWRALVLGTRDYVRKNGFSQAVIGLSGGIDSAVVATIAIDALGPENVTCVAMPARYSSPSSLEDARALCARRGCALLELDVDEVFEAYLRLLAEPFRGREADVTEENLQSRIRGNVLMALSNKQGWLVLTTGNKSEASVGYSTLYGDTAGGFAPIKDVFKTRLYELARWRNGQPGGWAIPEHSITRAPSAELRPDQTDQDSLPPYELLDAILARYVEDEMSVEEIVARGFDPEVTARVARLVDRAEYKRRQTPPGIKISERAFGRDRRMPITNRALATGVAPHRPV